ncbi:SDR family NAD(P)-dependent oxidoreductase [Cupriavidus necator]|uniref:SDR family NAD(P)-dependent oxidoreductase n=1 Tax=Cupriavidus necator TaxID=106590 RepID=UPI0005B4C99E|nr:SDR family NAD(P)-dependent oxidoreductase [Cupriavidus necator]
MSNSYDLSGKTALVTGGAKGLGRAIVAQLIDSGASVHVWDILPFQMDGASTEVVDVSDAEQVALALARLVDAGFRFDILINGAGYLGPMQPFENHEAGQWHRIIAVNLLGTMYVLQAMLPHMLRWGGGRIINMGSMAGKEGLVGLAAYSAASGGVVALTKAIGREMVSRNIYVNCVAPGPMDTDMIHALGSHEVAAMVRDSPAGRLGDPAEVAHLVAWLCSDASRFNAGAVFDMSGGRARF